MNYYDKLFMTPGTVDWQKNNSMVKIKILWSIPLKSGRAAAL